MAAAVALLCGCDAPARPEQSVEAAGSPSKAAYLSAPAVLTAKPGDGRLRLEGIAPPRSQVRLRTPTGQVVAGKVGETGRWRLELPLSREVRLYGLSAEENGRRLQAEGYLLLTDLGDAALLRAGSGAMVLSPPGPPRLMAVDFDGEGGAVISGMAPPGASVSVRIDGRPGPVGRADGAGRYSLALAEPLSSGTHEIQVLGDSFAGRALIDVTPAIPLENGPFRGGRTAAGLRVDWMTPGGGLQSTWILN